MQTGSPFRRYLSSKLSKHDKESKNKFIKTMKHKISQPKSFN